jgi:hypothetical protein
MSRFQTHKSVHIKLTTGTHANLRIELFKRGLSMQEVLEALSCEIVNGNSHISKILDELEYNKRHKLNNKKVIETDAESVFDAIASSGPFSSD